MEQDWYIQHNPTNFEHCYEKKNITLYTLNIQN